MFKKSVSIVVVLLMVVSVLPITVTASDIVASGYCGGQGDGTNLEWVLDSEGVLTISGSGQMKDFGQSLKDAETPPWRYYNSSLKKVIISNGVTTLGNFSFYQCFYITSIEIPDSVLRIGIYSLSGINDLTGTFVIPSSVLEIGDAAFSGSNIDTFIFPNGLQKIGAGAFANSDITGNVAFPVTLTELGERAFAGCRNITGDIYLSKNISNIGNGLFAECTNISSISIDPENEYYTSIGNIVYTKDNRTIIFGLPSISGELNIPEGVTEILDWAFYGCYNLSGKLIIPETVSYIGTSAFFGTKFEGELFIPDSVTEIGGSAFREMPNITSVRLSKNTKKIEGYTFRSSSSITNLVIPEGVIEIGVYAFSGTQIESVIFPESLNSLDIGSFSNYYGLSNFTNHYYFKGNAPKIKINGVYDPNSFPKDSILYYLEGTTGWKDTDAYDQATNTWNGYKLECWGTISTENANFTLFGKYNGSTGNSTVDSQTGLITNLMTSVTIDGVTYNVADTCTQEPVTLPDNFLSDFYYIAYNINEDNEVSEAKILPGIVCKLEAVDSTRKVIDTDIQPIIPIGEEYSLSPGSYYVSDVTVSNFLFDEMLGWIGDNVRVYCYGETIYKIIHVVEGTGTITSYDTLTTPHVVSIDGVNYSVANDEELTSSIIAGLYKKAKYTRYDDIIVLLNSYDDTIELKIEPFPRSYYLYLKILGKYEPNGGNLQIRDYNNDTLIIEIPSESVDYWYNDDESETTVSVLVNHNFEFDKEYYLFVPPNFLVDTTSGTPFVSDDLNDKEFTYWHTPLDVWRHENFGDIIDKKTYTDMFGAIDGSVLYLREKDGSTGGLCAGFVISTWSFYLHQAGAPEFFQDPRPNYIWDINLDAEMNDVGFDAKQYIKRAYLLQFLPEVQKQKQNNINNYKDLYDAVKISEESNNNYVYISLRGESGGHAVWGFRVEDFNNYSIIYVYDCNTPSVIRELYLYGTYPNFTSFGYKDEQLSLEGIVSFATDIDYISRYLKNIDTLNLPYDIIITDATKFTVNSKDNTTATYSNNSVSGNSSILIPVVSIDSVSDNIDPSYPMMWVAEESVFETQNNTPTPQTITYAVDNALLTFAINSSDKAQISTTSSDSDMALSINVDSATQETITYSILIDDKIIDLQIDGKVEDSFSLIGYEDHVEITGIENPVVSINDGNQTNHDSTNCEITDTIVINIIHTGEDYDIDIIVNQNAYNKFKITFVDEDGTTVLKDTKEYEYGTPAVNIEKPADPTKPSTAQYIYTFAGWTPKITDVTEDAIYRATYTSTVNVYTVTWIIDDRIETETYSYGDIPFHANPSKPADMMHYYTFKGWTPQIKRVTSDTTYTAVFEASLYPDFQFNPFSPNKPVSSITTQTEPENPAKSVFPFTDIDPLLPLYDIVEYIYENGIMNGVSDTLFDPYGSLTRGMVVTILHRMEGETMVSYTGAFTDVQDGEWYTESVEWAAANGIVNGYGNGKFGPTDEVTREQLAAILYRYAEFKGYTIRTEALDAEDAAMISGWAIENVKWAVTNDILWMSNGYVRSTENALRWEVAAAIRAFLEGVAK